MKSLNSDGHQFHQYQQNEQVPLILPELTKHKRKTMTYDIGNSDPGLGQAQNYGGVKLVKSLNIKKTMLNQS